jgi:aminoglycoside phosphotransferase (APT) family kinase protein
MDDATSGPRDDQLAQVAQYVFSRSQLVRAWRLQGGISAQMTALEVKTPDGHTQKMVLRQPGPLSARHDDQAAAQEYRILHCAQAAGVAAPTPYHLDESRQILSTPYLIMAYMEGQPDYTPAHGMEYARQAAAQLATIHRAEPSGCDLSFLPEQAARMESMLDFPVPPPDDVLDTAHIRAVLKSLGPLPPANRPVLLHGDFWPGNLLWQDGNLIAVVDWEDAACGDPLADLAISRLDILWIFGPDVLDEFTRCYRAQMSELDFSPLPHWDLYAALRPAFWFAEAAAAWPNLGRPDITEASMRADHRRFVAQALARLPRS